jgi:hypothetical protein
MPAIETGQPSWGSGLFIRYRKREIAIPTDEQFRRLFEQLRAELWVGEGLPS